MARTEYTIRPTVMTVDTRAAADACNRELMAAGDTYSREAAEEKIKECAPSLREWLTIEAAEGETVTVDLHDENGMQIKAAGVVVEALED